MEIEEAKKIIIQEAKTKIKEINNMHIGVSPYYTIEKKGLLKLIDLLKYGGI